MKAVIYARVPSTYESQSYNRQISDLKRWADFKHLDILEIFAEKISGFKKGLDELKFQLLRLNHRCFLPFSNRQVPY